MVLITSNEIRSRTKHENCNGGNSMKKTLMVLVMLTGIAGFSVLHAAELSGIVTDKNEKPMVIKVILKDAKGVQVGTPTTTAKDGTYSFKDIKPMSYIVTVGDNNQWKIFVGPGVTRRDFRLK
jgi:hypothetical protein